MSSLFLTNRFYYNADMNGVRRLILRRNNSQEDSDSGGILPLRKRDNVRQNWWDWLSVDMKEILNGSLSI